MTLPRRVIAFVEFDGTAQGIAYQPFEDFYDVCRVLTAFGL
jgi:hypothetical protein